MSRFPRPDNAIEDAAALKFGDVIWHVIGIWPPCGPSEHVVCRAASKHSEHPSYSEIHAGSANNLVFDTRFVDSEFQHMEFASDGNMQPGYSHNDNYWFRSQQEAEAARDHLRKHWEANPDLIAKEIAQREFDRMDDYDDYPEPDHDDYEDRVEWHARR